MKKSNVLVFLCCVCFIDIFLDKGLKIEYVHRISLTILVVGYFIVRQLEENKK
jgi:hypothetical protein